MSVPSSTAPDHGSTPAYVYYFVDCILKDAVKRGIDEESARALLVQTVIGAGELLARSADKPLDDFIKEVATEGGTTIEAVNTLKAEKMDKIIHGNRIYNHPGKR